MKYKTLKVSIENVIEANFEFASISNVSKIFRPLHFMILVKLF